MVTQRPLLTEGGEVVTLVGDNFGPETNLDLSAI